MNKFLKVLVTLSLLFALKVGMVGTARADEASAPDYTEKVITAKNLLNLTDDQVGKLRAIKAAAKAEAGPVILQYLGDLKSLKGKVEAAAPDAELKGLEDKMEGERQNLEGMKTKYFGQVRDVLNPMQQAKASLIVAKIKWEVVKKIVR